MKIKNVSQSYAYCFKVGGKLVGILPGCVAEVPKDSVDAVKRLCDLYAKNPETAVFVVADDKAAVTNAKAPEETAAEADARIRLEEKAAAADEKRKKAEALAAQKAGEAAREASSTGDMPPNVVRGADGKPIPFASGK